MNAPIVALERHLDAVYRHTGLDRPTITDQ